MWHLSKIAKRLAIYFGSVLVLFAIVLGVVFYQQYKTQTISLKEEEMKATSLRMAEVVSDNLDALEFYHGSAIANSRLAAYLDNVAPESVWLVDMNRNLSFNPDAFEKKSGRSLRERANLPTNMREAYDRLPKVVKDKVERCFQQGQGFVLREYSQRWRDTVITVGAPVLDRFGRVRATVLLHSPVNGLHQAVYRVLEVLAWSIAIAFVLGIVASALWARHFTEPLAKMEQIANELGEENYSARCNIQQNDEVGSLANTMDTLAERLSAAQEQRQRLEKMRRQFISNITHELRTPLTVVLASLEALKMGVITEPQEVQECYDGMYKEGVFAKEMITDLLELSKLQNPDFPLEKQDVNFVGIAKEAVASAEKLTREKGLTIVEDYDVEELTLSGDWRRLKQMLMVFFTNAIKFSDTNQKIEVMLKNRNLTITDHGCGMNEEMAAHAFESFYTSHDERNKEGSGLGLAIARGIADRHGLALTLTSAEGIGTTVRVVL